MTNPALPSSPVFWDIVEESLDEAEFLWNRWEDVLGAPVLTLSDVSLWIEERLLGSVEGLVVSGPSGIDRILAPGLASREPGRVTAAAHALIAGETDLGIQVFANAFATADAATQAAMRRGLELADRDDAHAHVGRRLGPLPDRAQALLLDAASFRRRFASPDFSACLSSRDVGLQRAAAVHLRCAPPVVQALWIDHALDRTAPLAQAAAVETAFRLGHPGARAACRELATADIAPSGEMLLLLAMLGTSADHQQVVAALAKGEEQREQALWALGFAGRKSGAHACIDLMAQGVDGRASKLAAEAFAAIVGLDLVKAGLILPDGAGPDEPVAFEDDDLDADLTTKHEDQLPIPDVPALIRWWAKHQDRFDDQTRYLGGRPVSFEILHQALVDGPMRRRHAIATELAIRTAGRHDVETRQFNAVQRRQMNGFAHLPREAFASPLARELSRAARRG